MPWKNVKKNPMSDEADVMAMGAGLVGLLKRAGITEDEGSF